MRIWKLGRGGARLVALSLWGATLLPASRGQTHPQFAMATVNRYNKLALLPHGQVRVLCTVMVGEVPAFELRRAADQNRDGRIDEQEGAALARRVADRFGRGASLELDGEKIALRFDNPVLGMIDALVAPSALSVDLTAVVPAAPGREHRLRYEDRAELLPEGEVEVLIEEGPGVKLLAAHQGAGPQAGDPALRTRFVFFGPSPSSLADRSISLRFVEGMATGTTRARAFWLAVVLGLLGGMTAVGWSWKRPTPKRNA